jgi:hypothetical protein|tara:strand:- start:578 stop:862 length:285 start_codon:yes stop_codon:yes gene_type:complete
MEKIKKIISSININKVKYYLKMLGFYCFELLGAALNFLCCLIGIYPCWELGVRFLVAVEGDRITKETSTQKKQKQEEEGKAKALEDKAMDTLDG